MSAEELVVLLEDLRQGEVSVTDALNKLLPIIARAKANSSVGKKRLYTANEVEEQIKSAELRWEYRDKFITPVPQEAQEGLRETINQMGNNAGKMWKCFSDFMTACSNGKTIVFRGNNFIAMDIISWNNAISRHPQVSPVVSNAYRVKALVNDPLRNEIWEYKEELKANGVNLDTVDDLEKILEKTGRGVPVKEEPLAVLADRKGYSEVRINNGNRYFRVSVEFRGYSPYAEIVGETVYEAESKARAYLQGLPDTKDEKEKK